MSIARHHADWLSLIEVSGPFVSLPVVQRAFPHGLPDLEPGLITEVRAAYADWQENGSTTAATHQAWVQYVLQRVLGFAPDLITSGQALPPGLEAKVDTFHETLRPDFAIVAPADREQRRPVLLVRVYPPQQRVESPLMGVVWKASPAARMMELLHATDLPLGLVTNGEEWQLVFAPKNESTGFASWYADLWLQEPVTLRAFQALLGQHRFFGVADDDTPAAMLRASLKDQHEVTDSLGAQVRQAVELLVRDFDRLDIESNRALLAGLKEADIYNASLTVMMRLVFLFCAEERGLLRLGEAFYDTHYAVSTLRQQLREIADQRGEEVLERRSDAWCRLLATFRAVHGGVAHDAMRMPAYGGSLFDPDRYPFLEGRAPGTLWRGTPSQPPHINNRVVLHLLEALQILRTKLPGGGPAEARRLSFRSLDIEQIGHVYEGLLDHTARRADAITFGLEGSSKATAPLITLEAIETLAVKGNDALIDDLEERTGRSRSALEKALGFRAATAKGKKKTQPSEPDSSPLVLHLSSEVTDHALAVACGHDSRLIARVRPFAGLMRRDSFDQFVLVQKDSLHIAPGDERRSTGTHYTPRSLTEPIVQHTLEPLVYTGPAEGLPRGEWKLKSPKELLALKVCDMAMGSGAFLVQTCRYLAERLVEAWDAAEKALAPNAEKVSSSSDPDFVIPNSSFVILPDGNLSRGNAAERLLPADPAERIAIARRYVADRCLYGVDINPMAVEMAKLSIWLITIDGQRPFTFLDHALKWGDSLLGVSSTKQIENFTLRGEKGQYVEVPFAALNLFRYVEEASTKRRVLENMPSNDHSQIETKQRLHIEAETSIAKVKALANCLIGFELRGLNGEQYEEQRDVAADHAGLAMTAPFDSFQFYAREQLNAKHPFHWPLEFPEVFDRGGFDAFVGNPPFIGGQKITAAVGTDYRNYLVEHLANGQRGSADICSYFFLRAGNLKRSDGGILGLLATNTIAQGDTREVGLEQLCKGAQIIRAISSAPWPGEAALEVAHVWIRSGTWLGEIVLDGKPVHGITPYLTVLANVVGKPYRLAANSGKSFQGSNVLGMGFMLLPEEAETLIAQDPKNREVLIPYLNGEDLNSRPDQSPSRWVVNFRNWPLDRSAPGVWATAGKTEREDWLRGGRVPADYSGRVAADFPSCLEIVERLVRPERAQNNDKHRRELWWRFTRPTLDLYAAIAGLPRALVAAQTSKYLSLSFQPVDVVFSHMTVVFAFADASAFSVLNTSWHTEWIIEYCSSLETRLRYLPTDGFETFPFPDRLSDLERIGWRYHDLRRQIMVAHGEGLTKIYNLFHARHEESEDIVRLRALHVEMDQAVADAYGWSDLNLGHGFHETKQGQRFTINEFARRTVLDRLLALNHQRYDEEVKAGLHDKKSKAKAKATKTTDSKGRRGAKFETPPSDSRSLPDEWRFAHATPALYAINLVTALLSSRVEGLLWTKLRDAFAAATTPSLLVKLALPDDKAMAEAWAKRWNEAATPNFLIEALRTLGNANLEVEAEGQKTRFALKDGPKQAPTEDVAYDAWIALKVTGELEQPVLDEDEEATLDAEIEKMLLTL